jgi:hypothetical protein
MIQRWCERYEVEEIIQIEDNSQTYSQQILLLCTTNPRRNGRGSNKILLDGRPEKGRIECKIIGMSVLDRMFQSPEIQPIIYVVPTCL